MLTERQQKLIDKCKKAGYGWKKYAESVEAQGSCTPKQEDKLVEMYQKIQHAECRKNGNFKHSGQNYEGCWDSDVSDSEAYQSGDYF